MSTPIITLIIYLMIGWATLIAARIAGKFLKEWKVDDEDFFWFVIIWPPVWCYALVIYSARGIMWSTDYVVEKIEAYIRKNRS
jgi:hypothetical protein